MIGKKAIQAAALLLIAASLASACGSKKASDAPSSPPSVNASPNNGSAQGGGPDNVGADGSPDQQLIEGTVPEVRAFLEEADFKNGDIYLSGGKLHINIVGLTPAIEQQFADRFQAGTYVLHDVKFSHQELEQAQQKLSGQDLYKKLNIYSSSVDVIHNRVEVQLPEEANAGAAEIKELLGEEIVSIVIEPLGDPQIIGVITEVDPENKRVLIQEEGSDQPNYWFSMNERSMLKDSTGKKAKFANFTKGSTVQVWSAGGIEESMPAQGTARQMVLVVDTK